jgi:peptide chain release factor 1
METVYVEIRAAEGGDDAKLLVREMVAIYATLAKQKGLEGDIIDDRPAQMTLEFSGTGVTALFSHEAGGHRWQRIPPTEKRGRVQTSTVTVAVLSPPVTIPDINEADIEEQLYKKSAGAGGQNNNKVATACRLHHIPTGIRVECCSERSQKTNRQRARELLFAKIEALHQGEVDGARAADRKSQVGSGMRGDKIRTYREQDDRVTDHRNNKKTSLMKVRRGGLEVLF